MLVLKCTTRNKECHNSSWDFCFKLHPSSPYTVFPVKEIFQQTSEKECLKFLWISHVPNWPKNLENTAKISFMSLSMTFTVLVFTKVTYAQQHHKQIFCTKVHHNQKQNMENMGRNSFMPLNMTVTEPICRKLMPI